MRSGCREPNAWIKRNDTMSTVGADVNALPQNQDQTGPLIGDLEDDEVIRCRDVDKLVWYYAIDRESVVLFHE